MVKACPHDYATKLRPAQVEEVEQFEIANPRQKLSALIVRCRL